MKMIVDMHPEIGMPLVSARESLAGLIRAALSTTRSDTRVTRLQVQVPSAEKPASLVDWLNAQASATRIYWRNRKDDWEAAGAGAADVVAEEGPFDLAGIIGRMALHHTAPHSNVRYFGGFCFERAVEADTRWKPFGACRFILPRIELLRRANDVFLACNIVPSTASDWEQACRDTLMALDTMPLEPAPRVSWEPLTLSRDDNPSEADWGGLMEEALAAIHEGTFDKVVLARESRFRFSEAPDPFAVFTRLAARARDAYGFCFQVDEAGAFFGASPELLYRRRDSAVETEAVAGTRPRGLSDDADEALANDLLQSDKERREQAFVFNAIRDVIENLCENVCVDAEPHLMKLPTCQHLCSRIRGTLAHGAGDAELLDALHPTPAVGGFPSEAALSWLREHEPFDRGWYAGPVGWIARDSAEFAVGIRSGLVSNDTLSLYSGAGIVAGSAAEKEWAEIENKMSAFTKVLHATGDDDA